MEVACLVGEKIPYLKNKCSRQLQALKALLIGRAWQATPEFLPGESHGQRSLAS